MGAVEPVAAMVALELSRKLDVPGLRFNFASLWAHDLAGRAQAFGNMVKNGMPLDKAAGLAGLITDEAA